MKEYLIKIKTDKDRHIPTSTRVKESIEMYLKLALGCEVSLEMVKEVQSLKKYPKTEQK